MSLYMSDVIKNIDMGDCTGLSSYAQGEGEDGEERRELESKHLGQADASPSRSCGRQGFFRIPQREHSPDDSLTPRLLIPDRLVIQLWFSLNVLLKTSDVGNLTPNSGVDGVWR